MTAPDPRLDEIQAIPAEAVETAAKVMYERKDTETTFGEVARAALEAAHPVLLAELRKAHEALERAGYRKTLPREGGEGWYEFFAPVGTTHIAYVHANGEIYLPEEGWTDLTHDDWFAASVKGHVHKLVRAAVAAAKGDEQ